jgi:hypothetical protein
MQNSKKEFGRNAGQLTFANIMVYVVSFLVLLFMLPVINTVVEDTLVPTMTNSTNPNAAMTIMLAEFIPAVFIFAMMVSVFNTAIPKQETRY